MARTPLNDDGKRFDYRVGSDGYVIGGIMQDAEPGSAPPNRPRMVLNGRYKGGGIVSRPPYAFYDDVPDQVLKDKTTYVESDVVWTGKFMAEHHPTRQNSQLWIGGFDGNTSFLRVADKPFEVPTSNVASYPSLIEKPPIVERFNGQVYVGDTGYLRRIYRVGEAVADLPTDDILYTFDGFRVYAMHEFGGRLFVFVADPLGSSNAYVFSYDGLTVYSEVTLGTPGADGASFAEFNGKLFLGIKGDTSLHYRDAAGNWSFLTDAAFKHSGFGNAMVPYANTLRIMGDTNTSAYTEPGGIPTLNVGTVFSGWTSNTVAAAIGPYAFFGGSKIWAGDTQDTPVFASQAVGNSPNKIMSEKASSVIVKGMAVFCNRVYFCYGYRTVANGGSAIGYFETPRQVYGAAGAVGTFAPTAGGAGTSYEYMKGDH